MGMCRAGPFRGGLGGHAVAAVDEDVADVLALGGAEFEGDAAGGLQSGLAILLGQRQQTEAGAVAVLGVAALVQDALDGATRGCTDALPPVDQALGPLADQVRANPLCPAGGPA